ncbi:hypothetical protein DM02DRAFT_384375 [Periconia macrospinosa]|uniref:Uncharacterized protein n=1 Tax=Periconia macrospinosa TaxID=97972 RepID=A0A2V1E946_9PLEO|nr:hypothetical protein DM02DRAFT_384375 [Periconia macrospinosa]
MSGFGRVGTAYLIILSAITNRIESALPESVLSDHSSCIIYPGSSGGSRVILFLFFRITLGRYGYGWRQRSFLRVLLYTQCSTYIPLFYQQHWTTAAQVQKNHFPCARGLDIYLNILILGLIHFLDEIVVSMADRHVFILSSHNVGYSFYQPCPVKTILGSKETLPSFIRPSPLSNSTYTTFYHGRPSGHSPLDRHPAAPLPPTGDRNNRAQLFRLTKTLIIFEFDIFEEPDQSGRCPCDFG